MKLSCLIYLTELLNWNIMLFMRELEEYNREELDLTNAIELALSESCCTAGLKLKSDRQLAATLKVSPSSVRSSMEVLERKGLISRKKGSGTFIRRVAPKPDVEPLRSISIESILQKKSADDIGEISTSFPITFNIGLWGDFHYTSPAVQQIFAAIISRAGSDLHSVYTTSMFRNYREPFSTEELERQYNSSTADGHIVIANCAEEFNRINKTTRKPCVFFSAGNLPVIEPIFYFNTTEAVERAVQLFASDGLSKIGMICLGSPEKYLRQEPALYNLAMERLGLDYRNIVQVPQPPTINNCFSNIAPMFDGGDIPEAVYVADDSCLSALQEVLNRRGIKPGRDIGIITLSNSGIPMPKDLNWSCYEFQPESLAELVVRGLVTELKDGISPTSMSINGKWRPGDTHKLN